MTLSEFIATYTNRSVSFPNCSDNQCMTLMHVYLSEVFGLTDPALLAQPSAYELYTNFSHLNGNQYFTLVANSPTNVPNPGDIIIYEPNNAKIGTGANGHVDIFIQGDVNQFTSLSCNWPEGSLPHVISHTYEGVLGWLTAKPQGHFISDAEQIIIDQKVKEAMAFEEFVTSGYNSPSDVNTKLQSYTTQISDLQAQIGKLTQNNEELQLEVKQNKDQMAQLANLTQQQATSDSTAIDAGLNATEALKNITSDMTLIAQELDTIYPPVKNPISAIHTLQNQLKAAQIELTKQAELNKVRAQQTSQAVQTVSKGFFSWLKAQVWISK